MNLYHDGENNTWLDLMMYVLIKVYCEFIITFLWNFMILKKKNV